MATQKLTTIDFIKTLQKFGKDYFSVADLEKITGLARSSLKVTLSRLTTQGILTRLTKGIYQLSLSEIDVRKIAGQLYYPSYLSFESALSLYGILSQIPYTQTFATTKKSKKMVIRGSEAEFTHLKKDLFFGYILDQGFYLAEAEKALLDQLYVTARGKRTVNIEELDLKEINKMKLETYAKKFPPYIKKLLDEVRKYLGTTPITNENKERI